MESDTGTEFLQLLTRHDRSLALYVYGLVSHQADADDILQQTKMVMWRSFSQFEPGTNFIAWARKVAFHQILSYRRRKSRDHLPLSEEMFEQLAENIAGQTDHEARRKEALQACLGRLSRKQRQLMLLRYEDELDIDEVAARTGTTPGAAYRALSRLRLTLLECIRARLKSEYSLP